MIINNRIKILFILILLITFTNNCQTFDAGYGPGNSPNSILVMVDKGVIELKIYSKITEYGEINDDKNNNKERPSMWWLFLGVLDVVYSEEPEPIKLNAGNQYGYYLKHNETATLEIKPIKDGENNEPVEIIIKYRGKERKYKLRVNVLSKSFSYTGG